MSASLRPAAPAGARQPATDPGQAAEQRPATQGSHAHPYQDGEGRVAPDGGAVGPSSRPSASERRAVGQGRSCRMGPDGPSEPGERETPEREPERLSGPVLPGRREWPGSRVGRRRAAAGLVAVCVLALGVAACSVKDAKAEASASASASASAAIARAEKGIADANASATASREAALTPELRAKRDAALAEPAPAKPPQLNEESAEGAAASVGYFLDLYRYAFMTGNTTEFAAMSEDRCKFCQSTINNATTLHNSGGWADRWEQTITDLTYYEKLDGYNYNRIKVIADHGEQISHPKGGTETKITEAMQGQTLNFAVRYMNGRWLVGGVEVEKTQ